MNRLPVVGAGKRRAGLGWSAGRRKIGSLWTVPTVVAAVGRRRDQGRAVAEIPTEIVLIKNKNC